ncbi:MULTISPECIES: response regulator [unclassified Aureimonas]|uniref:response regulator n=1 Tax=unclassified Aureimonas TaxID=2615206 RepID=UPI0009E6C899|nr:MULTISPECIES: response regulator [unclassified Aureimonas]
MTEGSLRVLVVEDEMMIAMLVEEMVQDLGHTVVGVAMRLETALELAREADIDLAVLDVNLGDAKSFPVAAILRARGIPFLFATGYGRKGIVEEFADSVVLNKPYQTTDLEKALAAAQTQGLQTIPTG